MALVSKLAEIIDAASTDDVTTANLLRKLKVVAARLETPPLLSWVDNELSGYPSGAELPAYRGPFRAPVDTDWLGPANARINNLPFPSAAVPERMRNAAFQLSFRQSASELEDIACRNDWVSAPWDADFVLIINSLIDQEEMQGPTPYHSLVSARRRISPSLVKSVLDNVRTRALEVALELERIQPDAGELGVKAVDPVAVNFVVTNNIYGHGNAVAIDSPGSRQQGSSTVIAGDLGRLLSAVKGAGLSDQQVADLEVAICADDADAEADKPGPRVRGFLAKLLAIGGVGAGQVATGAVGNVVAEMVQSYYGLG